MRSYKTYAIVVLVFLSLSGMFLYSYGKWSGNVVNPSDNVLVGDIATTTYPVDYIVGNISTPTSPLDGYIKYENKRYGFSYYHSPEASIKEFDEGSGAMTIVQENIKKVRGLQIFILPYKESTISEERFRLDVPSGIRKNVEKTYIGQPPVEAVMFNSHDAVLGETREVWFIYRGYLYEITTFKDAADWFVSLIQTWRFL